MPETTVVQIAVDQTAFSYDKLYSYCWPESWGEPRIGARVLVPLGVVTVVVKGWLCPARGKSTPKSIKRSPR